MAKTFALVMSLSVICLIPSCKRSPTDPIESQQSVVLSVYPDIGTLATSFSFNALLVVEGDTTEDMSGIKTRWDWNSDNVFDTEWLDSTAISHTFSILGRNNVKAELRLSDGTVLEGLSRAYVQELVQITTNTSTSFQGNIDWSRDGSQRIAFDWRPNSGEHRIYVVQYPGGTPQQVTFDRDTAFGCDHMPEWSPDGKKIVFNASGEWIAFLELSTGTVNTTQMQGSYPYAWSPNGRYVLSSTWQGVALFDFADSSWTTQFLPVSVSFCWSPAGDLIAAGNYPDKTLEIFAFESREVKAQFDVPYCGAKFEWSPDGRWISLGFVDTANVFHVLEYPSGRVYSGRADGLIHCWWPSWSEDGKLLAFEAQETDGGRWNEIWAIRFPQDLE